MANPREIAEQAFALLQNALSESEARASDLDDQLKRKRSPKNRLEEQLDVLTHRLENVEAERVRWEQQAGQLEEIAEAERAKVAQLKKKLEIAESGPEKLTKKEVNFWRAKAETIDAQIKEYQDRLTALRRELNERDAELEKLRATGAREVEPAEQQPQADDELRRQLEQRDEWLAELRLELHELRAQPTPPLETQAEVETLRSQITSLERALGEASNLRAAAEAAAIRSEHAIADRERAAQEAAAENERALREAAARHEQELREAAGRHDEAMRQTATQQAQALREVADRHEQALRELAERHELSERETATRHEQALAAAAAERELIEREAVAERARIELEAAAERENALAVAAAERERAVGEAVAEHERIAREATAAAEHARATLAEREHRIVELTAEVQQIRNELRQLEELDRSNAGRYEEQVAALTRDTEALRTRIDQDRHETSAARAALELALHEREQKIDRQQQLLLANERSFEDLRNQLAEREQAVTEARRQAEEQRRALEECEREIAGRQRELRDLSDAVAERDGRLAESSTELEQMRASLTTRERDIDSLRESLQDAQHELEQARVTLTANERELISLRETLGTSSRELDELRSAQAGLETKLADAVRDMDAAREQIAGLEVELKEEREHAESLGELANERREHMTKLQEQVEEAEERFADANWRLGKALYFERIVNRRKGLIQKLLGALRAKMKANVALKAGLDGLRTFKQAAEMNQHKLLQRIDSLKADLKEAEETVKRHQGATAAKEELTGAVARATALEERLNTQAELIQSLEADLKTARLTQKAGSEQNDDIARLTKELEAKNQVISQLQADTDDQQRKLAKLRGSESETVRLKALTEKDRSEIDALQREIAQLREALAHQSEVAAASGNNADLEARLKERENSLNRLMGTIKEHEATIKKLTESADSWKRKYQFLASDQPDAYKSDPEK